MATLKLGWTDTNTSGTWGTSLGKQKYFIAVDSNVIAGLTKVTFQINWKTSLSSDGDLNIGIHPTAGGSSTVSGFYWLSDTYHRGNSYGISTIEIPVSQFKHCCITNGNRQIYVMFGATVTRKWYWTTTSGLIDTDGHQCSALLTLTYNPSYTLTVNAGSGGTVSGGGTYVSGTAVTIKATPNAGYRFSKWSDGNTSATRTVTVNGAATYTAYFVPDTVNRIYVGTTLTNGVYIGTTKAKEIYIGTTKIYG